MVTTITYSGGDIAPDVMDGYAAARETGTVVHRILDRENPDVTLRAAGLRSGQFVFVFADQAAALNAYAALSLPEVFTLSDDEVLAVAMSFVVADGDLTIALDNETRRVWLVRVPFYEVLP